MKIVQTLSVCLLTALSLLSCKQVNENLLPEAETKIEIAPIEFSPNTLSFANEDEMYETVGAISQLSVEQKRDWYAQYPNFTSMEAAKDQISGQMSECKTYDNAIKLRNAYSEIFIFNHDLAEGDVAPYYPMDESYNAMVCNAYGDVEIAGKIVNYNNIKSYDDTWCAKISKQAQVATRVGKIESANHLHIWTNSRKMWARAINNNNEVWLEVRAQQKICFIFCAWHSYSNEFTFAPTSIEQQGSVTYIPWNNLFYAADVRNVPRPNLLLQDGAQMKAFRMDGGYVQRGYRIHSNGVGSENAGILLVRF